MLRCFFKWPHGISQTNIDIWYKQFVAKKVPLRFRHQHTLYTSRHPTQWPTFPHIIHHPVWHASLWRNILCWKWARNREMSSAGNSPQNCCKPWWAHMGHQGPSLASKETTDKDPEHINCKFSRSYCFATVLSKRQQAGVEIRNGFSAMPLPMTVCVCSGRQAAGVAGLEKGLFPIPFMTESTICTQSFAKATWKNPCGIERTRCKKGHAKRDASSQWFLCFVRYCRGGSPVRARGWNGWKFTELFGYIKFFFGGWKVSWKLVLTCFIPPLDKYVFYWIEATTEGNFSNVGTCNM